MATAAKGLLVNGPTYKVSSFIPSPSQVVDRIGQVAEQNTARSEQQAADLRNWQQEQNRIAMEFNAAEAAKNRDWQEYMSNTAHQREIRDLKLAGLNPVLSAMGGNGAAVTSGATASGVTSSGSKGEVDTSMNQALVSLLGSFLSAQTSLENARLSAETNQAIADRNNASAELVAQINGMYGNERARIAGEYGLAGTKYSADTSRANAELAAVASILNNSNTNATAKSVQKSKEKHDEYMAKYYPQTNAGLVSSMTDRALDFGDMILEGLGLGSSAPRDRERAKARGDSYSSRRGSFGGK